MKRTIPILILCAVFLAGCHIAADKSESSYLGPGATWTRVEGPGLDNNTVAAVTGNQPTTKPSGWITKIDHMVAGDGPEGQMTADVNHAFGMDGIQLAPFTIAPGVHAVTKQGGSKSEVTPEGVKKKIEPKKGWTIAEIIRYALAAVIVIAAGLGALYYWVPGSRPVIRGIVSLLPGLGKSEENVKAKAVKETTDGPSN